MRQIALKYNQGATNGYGKDISGTTEEWACNKEGEGAFSRREDGTWQQHAGTGQAGPFRTPAQLRAFIRAQYGVRGCRIIETIGWPE
jgi:hypothetical protein